MWTEIQIVHHHSSLFIDHECDKLALFPSYGFLHSSIRFCFTIAPMSKFNSGARDRVSYCISIARQFVAMHRVSHRIAD